VPAQATKSQDVDAAPRKREEPEGKGVPLLAGKGSRMQLPGNGSEPTTTSLAAIGGSGVQFIRAPTIGGVRVVYWHTLPVHASCLLPPPSRSPVPCVPTVFRGS